MDQPRHTDAEYWPEPLGRGLLVELGYTETAEAGSVALPEHKRLETTSVAQVRNASHMLPDDVTDELLPDGPGSFGEKLLISQAQVNTLEEATYEACGLELPDAGNGGVGELGFINVERLIAVIEESDHLPFTPMGSMVFFEFDYKENTNRFVGHESGDVLEREEVGEESDELVKPERSEATKNQLATVLGTGPNAEILEPGDRVIASRFSESIKYEDEEYPFVTDEHQVRGIVEKGGVDLDEQADN